MGEERDEALCFVIKPLLISKKEVDDHHRCAKEMVVEVGLKEAHLRQGFDKRVHFFIPFIQRFRVEDDQRLAHRHVPIATAQMRTAELALRQGLGGFKWHREFGRRQSSHHGSLYG